MRTIKGNYGECRFVDNMDPDKGMPSIGDQTFDLCLTDPPYNVNAQPHSQAKKKYVHDISYDDNIDDYEEFILPRFREWNRITKGLIFTPGNVNLKFWYTNTDPRDILFHHKPNGAGITPMCFQNRCEILLCYGKFNRKFMRNIYSIHLKNGFLREKMDLIHPHPKSFELWTAIIKDTIPESVIDPFLGSGTTAQACETMGIPWLGYELSEDYYSDIEKRIAKGITEHSRFRPPKKTINKTLFPKEGID